MGSLLLDHTMRELANSFPDCKLAYLHVVDYNTSAIRFYEKNEFINYGTEKDHYIIHG